MTDIELIRKCGEKFGITEWVSEKHLTFRKGKGRALEQWNPLTDDAQAMALVKQMKLDCTYSKSLALWAVCDQSGVSCCAADLNRAICECVARLP